MARIDDALASVETPVLTKILLQTGAFHRKLPGFEPGMFRVSQGWKIILFHLVKSHVRCNATNKLLLFTELPFLFPVTHTRLCDFDKTIEIYKIPKEI